MEIKGSAAIVTGGASGLGAATSTLLHKFGARVVVADVQDEKGEALVAELGSEATYVHVDVTNTEQVQAAVELAIRRLGKIDILVNCAGVSPLGQTLTSRGPLKLESFKRAIDINLIGTFDFVRLCAAQMARNEANDEGERGVIVNTASIAAFDGQLGSVAYTASKAGVAAITLTIARDLGGYGIRVCSIAPGPFQTPMLGQAGGDAEATAAQGAFPRRLGRPDEYARLVRHIVENSMLNGETIRLDGGLRLPARHEPVRR